MPTEIEIQPCSACGGEVRSSLHKCDPKDFARHNAKKLGENTLHVIGKVLAKHDAGIIEGVLEQIDELNAELSRFRMPSALQIELALLLQEAVTLAEIGDITEETEAHGYGAWLKQARSALKRATK